jgi:hypothetical protein
MLGLELHRKVEMLLVKEVAAEVVVVQELIQVQGGLLRLGQALVLEALLGLALLVEQALHGLLDFLPTGGEGQEELVVLEEQVVLRERVMDLLVLTHHHKLFLQEQAVHQANT